MIAWRSQASALSATFSVVYPVRVGPAWARPTKVSGTAAQMTDYLLVYRDSAPLHPWSGEAFDVSGQAAEAK
jgi:hypothetical protein